MENMEKEPNNNYLLYYTKYHPYMGGNNNYNIENESLELNEDENDNNNNIINGRWSQKEHLLFIKGCLIYNNNWKMVQNYIQTRSCSQIRSHSQKYFYKLNKKYQNNNVAKILNQEEINKLINKNKFSNKDMENAEMHILTLFNGNKDRTKDKDLIEENDENNFNIKKKAKKKNMKTPTKEKEKIFDITKIPKEEKFKKEEMVEEKTDSNNNDSEKENEDVNIINPDEYEEENNSCDKKILKKDILAEKEDTEIVSQKEEFINKCLDSKDPKDLVNLLKYFGNDINFKVNDINILKKYQFYLGLDLDNSEENNDENSKNKNEELNHMSNNSPNAYYPYIITPSGTGIQFNPLFNPKIIFNPQIINQS